MPSSLWQDRRDLPDRSVGGDRSVPETVDVAVVGAGITGLTAAALLARAGRSVVVLEGGRIAGGTTGRSTAKVSLLQGTRLSTLAQQHPAAVLDQYVEAHREGQAWLRRFCDDHGVEQQERPAVTFAPDEQGRRTARRELELARAHGLDARWEDEVGLPFRTAGGVRLDGQMQVDPVEVADALAVDAERHGAVVLEEARVRRVSGIDPVSVHTSAGTVTASTVVVATGLPILDRGGFFARMVPSRSYSLALAVDEPVTSAMYLSTASGSGSRSVRDAWDPELGHLLVLGGAGHTTGRDDAEARLGELRHWAAMHFPQGREVGAWSAQDFVPARGLPFAGPVLPGQDAIQVAGGFAKWGMTGGVAAAHAIAARVLGGRTDWAEVMDPWQRRELRSLPSLAKDNAAVGLRMATGWMHAVAAREPREVSAVCTHLGGAVQWNGVERSWDCPLHGSRFAEDGSVLDGPATCGLRRR